MKRFVWASIIFVMALLFQVGSVAAEQSFAYQTNVDGTISITRYSGQAGEVNIPSQIDGQMVTAIADEAFMNNGLLVSVIVPEGVVSIGRSSFQGSYNLAAISLPTTLRSIGESAFRSAGKLESIIIPEGITVLPDYAFDRCMKMTEILLPSTLKAIGKNSLAVTGITEIKLPEGLESIGSHAFYGNAYLKSITLPNRISSLGDFAFFVCENLAEVVLPAGKLTTLPSGVFNQCPNLSSVAIPKSVTRISDDAFFTGSLRPANLKIFAPSGSEGEAFARRSSLSFQSIAMANTVEMLVDGRNLTNQTVAIDLSSYARTFNIVANVKPDSFWPGVELSSSSPKIASVDVFGTVIAHQKGEAIITATAVDGSGAKANIKVNIANLAKSVSIEGDSSIQSEGRATLRAIVLPESSDNRSVDWSVSDQNVASISNKGVVQAMDVSEKKNIVVTAKAKDGSGVYADFEMSILPLVSEILLQSGNQRINNKDSIILDMAAGKTSLAVQSSIRPADAAQMLAWNSSKPKVASVDENGVIIAHTKGTTNITATSTDGSKKTISFTINVVNLVKDIIISGEQSVASAQKITLKATVLPENSDNNKVEWQISDESVARVNKSGVVTARKTDVKREVTITATALDGSGVSASFSLSIHPLAQSVTISRDQQVMKNKESFELIVGSSVKLDAVIDSSDAIQSVNWKSSNDKVISIDENGLVTALKKGKATITATAADGSRKRATCEITVTNP